MWPRGHAWPGGMCGWGACMVRGSCMARGHAWQVGICATHTPPPPTQPDTMRYSQSMSGQYASYWNWLGACMARGSCMAGGMHGRGAYVPHTHPHPPPEIRSVNERAVRILLECILVFTSFMECIYKNLVLKVIDTYLQSLMNSVWYVSVPYLIPLSKPRGVSVSTTSSNSNTFRSLTVIQRNMALKHNRASSSYFFLFFPIFLSILLFFLFFSNFLLFFLFFSHFTYNKQIFVRDLNILSLFKYVVCRVH